MAAEHAAAARATEVEALQLKLVEQAAALSATSSVERKKAAASAALGAIGSVGVGGSPDDGGGSTDDSDIGSDAGDAGKGMGTDPRLARKVIEPPDLEIVMHVHVMSSLPAHPGRHTRSHT